MNREVFIAATAVDSDPLLETVASVLRIRRVRAESLVWSALGGTDEVRIWITVSAPEIQYRDLLTGLAQVTGVLEVAPLGPEHSLIRNLHRARLNGYPADHDGSPIAP
jgi:hypothetical protein